MHDLGWRPAGRHGATAAGVAAPRLLGAAWKLYG
jgi:hypothetical protein